MFEKLKEFYANHTMWVNIVCGLFVVVIVYKFLKKK